MKITYKSVTGETFEIETDEKIGSIILESRRAEHANNERHRYHAAYSLDNDEYEDHDEAAVDDDPCQRLTDAEESKRLYTALGKLSPVQRRRLLKLAAGMSIAEIARSEGAAFNSVKESIAAAQKKMKNLL